MPLNTVNDIQNSRIELNFHFQALSNKQKKSSNSKRIYETFSHLEQVRQFIYKYCQSPEKVNVVNLLMF